MKKYPDQGKVDTRTILLCIICLLSFANSCYEQPENYRFCRVEFTLNGERYDMDCYSKDRQWKNILSVRKDYDVQMSCYPTSHNDSTLNVKFICGLDTEDGLIFDIAIVAKNQEYFVNNERYSYKPISLFRIGTPLVSTGNIKESSISSLSYGFRLIEDGHDAFMFMFDLDYMDEDSQELIEIRDGVVVISDYITHTCDYKKYIKREDE